MSGPYRHVYTCDTSDDFRIAHADRAKIIQKVRELYPKERFNGLVAAAQIWDVELYNENENISEENPSYGDVVDIDLSYNGWCGDTRFLKLIAEFCEGRAEFVYQPVGNLEPIIKVVIEDRTFKEYKAELTWIEVAKENK